MQAQDREALDVVTARFFKGLGDPIRLKVKEFLEDGEKSVSEIVERFDIAHLVYNQSDRGEFILRRPKAITRKDGTRFSVTDYSEVKVFSGQNNIFAAM